MSVMKDNRAAPVVNDVRNREMKVLVMGMGRTGTTGNMAEETNPYLSPG